MTRINVMAMVVMMFFIMSCSENPSSPTVGQGGSGGGSELPGLPGVLFSVDAITKNVFRLDLGSWGINSLDTEAADLALPIISANTQTTAPFG